MFSADLSREWAALIAIGVAIGFVMLLFTLKRLVANRTRKRAALRTAYDELEDTHGEFQRGRRNFFILLFILISFMVTVYILKSG